jgi:heme-degrading monooxygenase HmoA
MHAAIYRWRVAPEHEADFRRRWHEITQDIVEHHGGGGSRLHRAENGDWVAYARWPDKADRDKAFAARMRAKHDTTPQEEGKAVLLEEIWLTVTDDLLIPENDLPERFHEET